jgi:hypothetical protein
MGIAAIGGEFPEAPSCRIGVPRVGNKTPDIGPQAEMLARLRAIAEETHKLRRELQESIRPAAKPAGDAVVDGKRKRRKHNRKSPPS